MPTKCGLIQGLCMVFRINRIYFPKQNQPNSLCNWDSSLLKDGNNVYISFNILRVKNEANTANIVKVGLSGANKEWGVPIDPFT